MKTSYKREIIHTPHQAYNFLKKIPANVFRQGRLDAPGGHCALGWFYAKNKVPKFLYPLQREQLIRANDNTRDLSIKQSVLNYLKTLERENV